MDQSRSKVCFLRCPALLSPSTASGMHSLPGKPDTEHYRLHVNEPRKLRKVTSGLSTVTDKASEEIALNSPSTVSVHPKHWFWFIHVGTAVYFNTQFPSIRLVFERCFNTLADCIV